MFIKNRIANPIQVESIGLGLEQNAANAYIRKKVLGWKFPIQGIIPSDDDLLERYRMTKNDAIEPDRCCVNCGCEFRQWDSTF
jgi:hypothetical protein